MTQSDKSIPLIPTESTSTALNRLILVDNTDRIFFLRFLDRVFLVSFFFCIDNHADNGAAVPHVALCKAPASSIKSTRRKKAVRTAQTAGVKNERCSPDPEIGTESSRSDSPHSPCSSSFRTRTPSFPGTPPNPPFTPPERFSPASNLNSSGGNKLMMEGVHMSRNYSDFMRSLAAKYNNANPNEYVLGLVAAALAIAVTLHNST